MVQCGNENLKIMSDQALKEYSPIENYITGYRLYAGELTIEIESKNIVAVCKALKEQLGFNYLSDITASDHFIDGKRFELGYNLVNIEGRKRIRVSTRVEENPAEIESITPLWPSADWYERECWDMMGIRFHGHPDLRRIYMPEDFEYFPLRKEFPLIGIPGSIQLPEKDSPKTYK
jgi:NADH-quinone oxidoreductase subunit C